MNQKITDYINNNFSTLQSITRKITHNHELSDDLLQDVIFQLYERDNLVLKRYDDDSIRYYLVAVLKLNWNSSTSRFHYKFRKDSHLFVDFDSCYDLSEQEYEETIFDNRMDTMLNSIEELDFFDKKVLELYLELGSYQKVKEQTKIPISSISRYIKEIKEELKNNILCQEQKKKEDVRLVKTKKLQHSIQ